MLTLSRPRTMASKHGIALLKDGGLVCRCGWRCEENEPGDRAWRNNRLLDLYNVHKKVVKS